MDFFDTSNSLSLDPSLYTSPGGIDTSFSSTPSFNPSSFLSSPSYQYSQAVNSTATQPVQVTQPVTSTAARPGNSFADTAQLIGEGLHGVGNVVRAFRGVDPIRYPGKTLAESKAQKARDAKVMEMFETLTGKSREEADKTRNEAETSGSEVVAASDSEPAPMQVEAEQPARRGRAGDMEDFYGEGMKGGLQDYDPEDGLIEREVLIDNDGIRVLKDDLLRRAQPGQVSTFDLAQSPFG